MRAALLLCRVLCCLAAGWLLRVAWLLPPSPVPPVSTIGISPEQIYIAAACLLPALLLLLACRWRSTTLLAAQLLLVAAGLEGLGWLTLQVRQSRAPVKKEFFSEGRFWNSTCGLAGYCLEPDIRLQHSLSLDDRLLFNATYTSDAFGRRTTLLPDNATPSKFLHFFGCSFTFGWQLDDNATLPSQLAALAPRWRPYNHGLGGYGTANMLARIRMTDFNATTAEASGAAVYVYMEDHLGRTVGGSHSLQWSKSFPRFTLHEGRLEYEGALWTTRPFQNAGVLLLHRASLFRALRLATPWRVTPAQLDLMAALIRASRDELASATRLERFIMLLTPGWSTHGRDIAARLRGTGVEVLDCADLYPRDDPARLILVPGDVHPSPLGNAMVAQRLADMLSRAP